MLCHWPLFQVDYKPPSVGAPCRNQSNQLPFKCSILVRPFCQGQKWPFSKWNMVVQKSAKPEISLNFKTKNTGINGTRRIWIKNSYFIDLEHVNQMGLKWVNYSRRMQFGPHNWICVATLVQRALVQLNNPKLIRKIWNRTWSVNQVNLKFTNNNGLISLWTNFI